MTDFIVKTVPIDGLSWPLRSLLQSLDSRELGDAEWWRRMASLQNAAARAGDGELLAALDQKKKTRWGTAFEAPEVVTPNNFPPLSIEECVKRWFLSLSSEEQKAILKQAMEKLLEGTDEDGKKLFSKKQHWMAVYVVLRDRLSISVPHISFADYAESITPETCPSKLRISSSTMTNFSKTLPESTCYRIKSKPFERLCTTLWAIIKNIYYSMVSTNQ
jgi:hypothetical protein